MKCTHRPPEAAQVLHGPCPLHRPTPFPVLYRAWVSHNKQVSRSRINTTGLNQTPAATRGEPPGALVRDLLELFQGEFDNYDQVRQNVKEFVRSDTCKYVNTLCEVKAFFGGQQQCHTRQKNIADGSDRPVVLRY